MISSGYTCSALERVTRIELAPSAWKAEVLPLNYTRSSAGLARQVPTIVQDLAVCESRV